MVEFPLYTASRYQVSASIYYLLSGSTGYTVVVLCELIQVERRKFSAPRLGFVWVRLRLKVRMLRAEVVETLIYGCVAWSPGKTDLR